MYLVLKNRNIQCNFCSVLFRLLVGDSKWKEMIHSSYFPRIGAITISLQHQTLKTSPTLPLPRRRVERKLVSIAVFSVIFSNLPLVLCFKKTCTIHKVLVEVNSDKSWRRVGIALSTVTRHVLLCLSQVVARDAELEKEFVGTLTGTVATGPHFHTSRNLLLLKIMTSCWSVIK